jgi:phosphoribosyl-ATP pyrophosphohydrolase/phosphoribosyl-AMP cyclohydrolase/histidinol dehydrogenase
MTLLRRVTLEDLHNRPQRRAFDDATLAAATRIVEDVRRRGEAAVREHGERFRDLAPGAPLVISRDRLEAARAALPTDVRALLERTAERIAAFANAQLATIRPMETAVHGGRAGHRIVPLSVAGCYAPGGRYPLPSSMLMTTVTARAAGVRTVWAASPRPSDVMMAAAAIGGADGLLAVGGAQAIAALSCGAGEVPRCDIIVGPGNRHVTAAKFAVSADVAIDMLAGPSELVILADESSDAGLIAADLLAQAEHDADAIPILVATDAGLIDRVETALGQQLADLPTAETALAALRNGFAVVVAGRDEAVATCDRLAPEHLHIHAANAAELAERVSCYGALFIGANSAEAFGDYGVGPNHVLPTGGTARWSAGLSVTTFLRCRTWLAMGGASGVQDVCEDAAALARLEGLEAHARSAEARRER